MKKLQCSLSLQILEAEPFLFQYPRVLLWQSIVSVTPNRLRLLLNNLYHLDRVVNVLEVYLLNNPYRSMLGYLCLVSV
jgi:hypothetical protein